MSCAVNTSGQATSFSTNRIEDNEVKVGHKPLTSFFISDILSGGDKKVKTLSTSSSSSSPAPDDDYEKKHHVTDDVDFMDQKSQQLTNFHQHLFRLQHRHHHHPPSFPHQFLFAQSPLFSPRVERDITPQHHHHNTNPTHHHHHHHHHQQQQHIFLHQHLSEQQQRNSDKKRHYPHHHQPPSPIKRPWDEESSRSPRASDDIIKSDEEIEVDVSSYETDDDDVISVRPSSDNNKVVCPLDALLRMTSQTFEPEEGPESCNDSTNSCSSKQTNNNNSSTANKKRRKSRTAFTNKQIFELEKRFVYQKYLTPVDRDDIAQSLGLSNAQVITWFQNRRAKLKRDMEELKADVIAAKTLGKEPVANVIIGGIEELLQGTRDSLRKKPPQKSSHHYPTVNNSATNHDRRHYDGVYDSSRISRGRRSPSSDWSGHVRADQSEKENSDVSSVKSDDVMK